MDIKSLFEEKFSYQGKIFACGKLPWLSKNLFLQKYSLIKTKPLLVENFPDREKVFVCGKISWSNFCKWSVEVYSGILQTSKMESYVTIVNGFWLHRCATSGETEGFLPCLFLKTESKCPDFAKKVPWGYFFCVSYIKCLLKCPYSKKLTRPRKSSGCSLVENHCCKVLQGRCFLVGQSL